MFYGNWKKVLEIKHYENIIIGKPIIPVWELVASSKQDYKEKEEPITYFTETRSIAKIFVEIGIVKSVSEVRRNKPELCNELNALDCINVKWGKHKFWVVVGE